MAAQRRIRHGAAHALAIFFYLMGSLLATWPLAAFFTTHVTGDGIDDPALAWNLWWIKARLVDHLQPDIFHSGWLFHPIGINLGYYTLTPLNGLLSVPLQSALTLVVANNLLLLSSFVLGGYGTLLLARTVWARPLARVDGRVGWIIVWLAGAFYAFAGTKLFYASLGQFNIASSQWIPFCALYVWRTLHSADSRSARRNGAWAGLFLVLQAWAELTYASFLIIFCALAYLYFAWHWFIRPPRQASQWWRGTQGMVTAAVVFVAGITPFLAAIVPDMRREGDFFAAGGGFADTFSADLLGFLVPTRLHPWLGDWTAGLPFANDKAQHIYLGYTIMALIVIGIAHGMAMRRRGATWFWLLMLLAFWLLTLGPYVRWAGVDTPIPGPFALVSQLPFFSGNRYPSRYAVMLWLAAAMLATSGLLWLATHARLRGLAPRNGVTLAVVALIFVAEHVSVPLPLTDFRVPPLYTQLASQPGDFALLELPTGWRNGARVLGKSDVVIMMQQWYQTAHGKRRLGGNTSRNPEYKFQYFSATPVLARLIAAMNADRAHLGPVLEADYATLVTEVRQDAPQLFHLLGIRYVTLHVEKAPDLLVRLVEDALPVRVVDEWHGPNWTGSPSTIRLYAVDDLTPLYPLEIDLATAGAQLYLAEGWSPVGSAGIGRFATRPQVDLLLPNLPEGGAVTLTFARATRVTYRYAGRALGTFDGLTHALAVPAVPDSSPTVRLTLAFDDPPLPVTTLSTTPTLFGSAEASLDPGVSILAQSAGEEVGNLAHLWVNGRDWALHARGYNLVALTPAGEVLAAAAFDTMLAGESARMADWLTSWEPGTVIAGAVADTAEHQAGDALGQVAIDALQRLGVTGDLRGKFRWSHAFIGVVGAPQATAIEELQLIHPATVWAGVPLPAVAGYGPLQRITVARP